MAKGSGKSSLKGMPAGMPKSMPAGMPKSGMKKEMGSMKNAVKSGGGKKGK